MSYALNDAATTAPPDAPNHTKGSSQTSLFFHQVLYSLGQYSLLSSSFYPHLFLMVPDLSPSPSPHSTPTPASLGKGYLQQYIYRDRAFPNQFILCLQDKVFKMFQILSFLSAANLVLPDCSTLPVELWAIILR
jgi:hypothetical protein